MKKRFLIATALLTMTISSMTVYAAPKTMPDGNVFDAEYYAQNNPDVVAVLGTDENVLYQHYQNFGKNEGRKPYEGLKETSIREQVNALGIYYTPERDEEFPPSTEYSKNYASAPVTIHTDEVTTRVVDRTTNEIINEGVNRNQELKNGFQRGDYTNDPLYLAFAQELMKQREIYYSTGGNEKASSLVVYRDYANGIYFGDESIEYLRDVVGNLSVDYMESILGGPLTWVLLNSVSDTSGDFSKRLGAPQKRCVSMLIWPSLKIDPNLKNE